MQNFFSFETEKQVYPRLVLKPKMAKSRPEIKFQVKSIEQSTSKYIQSWEIYKLFIYVRL